MKHRGATPRIFISYSHDTTAHRERVLSLSERLRADGIETRLDRYVSGAPAEGWPRWMLNQIDWAEFILLVCTETYYRRFRGHEEPGKGKGVDWEGAVITQELYDARSATIKFVPVLFEATDERFIPEPVRGHNFYVLNSEQAYQDLYDFLLGQAGAEPGPVGEPKRKPRVRAKPLVFGGEGGRSGHPSGLDYSNPQEIPLAKVDSGAREGAGRNDDRGRNGSRVEPMADYQHPKRAIVSVWHKEVGGGGTFLGSGVFISPRHVLTAKHVIDQQGYRDELRLGLIDGYPSVPVKTLHTHPELDIALIDLEKEFSDQGLAWADWNSNGLEGKKVDFYGINRLNHSRDENKDHTVGTWHPESGGYLCDHRVLKGFSGGAAVVDGRMVGVIVERHESEQVTLFIPLCLAADWFNRMVSAEDRGRYFPVQPVPAKTHRHEIQGAFAQRVRQEIARVLGRPKLRSLADTLRETAPKEAATVLPESLLVPKQDHCNIDSAISTLRVATKACLQKLTGNGSSAAPDIVQGATDVLGWLVLLAVSEMWLQSDAGLPERLLSAEQIQIPVATEAGIEVVIARLHAWQARLKLVGDTKVRGVTQVDWDELELGFTKKDALTEIKRLIWKTVHGDEAPHPFGKVDEDDLKMTLKDRYEQDKQHYYIVIPAERYDRIASAGQLLTELRRDLEYLGAFMIGSKTGDQILVIAEGGLRAKIREFLLMVKDYL